MVLMFCIFSLKSRHVGAWPLFSADTHDSGCILCFPLCFPSVEIDGSRTNGPEELDLAIFLFSKTKTTSSTKPLRKAVLPSEQTPWSSPDIALTLLAIATHGMRDHEMDRETWSNSPILRDFKTNMRLTDVQHNTLVKKRMRTCGIDQADQQCALSLLLSDQFVQLCPIM